MALPEFNVDGDLPVGIHQATLAEVVTRFGAGTRQRQLVTERLVKIFELAQATGQLLRFIILAVTLLASQRPMMLI